MSKYALFYPTLLCKHVRDNRWYVINGGWHLEAGIYPLEGETELPEKLWEGDKLPYPSRDYDENIDAIEHFIATSYYNRDGN
jgi:hypothetical protein